MYLFCLWLDCVQAALVGNDICNDETNNIDCNFDGGDCCNRCSNTDQCLDCVCHEGSPFVSCE